MGASSSTELIRLRTDDNVILHGLLSSSEAPCESSFDAAIVVHGLGGNFYSSRMNVRLAAALNDLGITTILINTRGHDEVNVSIRDGRAANIGAAFEIVDECRHDLAAWSDELTARGFHRIVLIGHSLGAIKSIYSQALQPHPSVHAIVAISASRLCHQDFLASQHNQAFSASFLQAEELVNQGAGQKLMKVEFPFPTHISAAAYRDKYGPEDRYNWLRYAHRLDSPVLLIFGELELDQNAAFIGILDDFEKLELCQAQFEIKKIAGADHFYAGRQSDLIVAIIDWIRQR